MLHIKLICVGKLKESYYREALAEYEKRLGPFCRLELTELSEERLRERPSQAEIQAALEREALLIEKQFPRDGILICLCIEGKQLSSEELSEYLIRTEIAGKSRISFVIGSSFGLSETVKRKADLCLSMSKMTFPHHLARVMLAEQLYRSFMIREGTKYHK